MWKCKKRRWCYFLKNLESFDHIPSILKEPIFEKAFHTSEIGAMNKEEYDVYMKSLMSYWESKGMIDTALAEGIEKGTIKGRMEGRMEEKREVVKNAILLGMNDEQISLLTGLSVDEIKDIRKDL